MEFLENGGIAPPGVVVYSGRSNPLRKAMERVWKDTFFTYPDAEDFPQTLPPEITQPFTDAFHRVLRDLEISALPDSQAAWLLAGALLMDQETAWDRQRYR